MGTTGSPSTPTSARVVVVEDHALFAQALALALSLSPHRVFQEIVDEGRTVASLLAAVTHRRPDVVLLDLELGSYVDGQRLIAPLAASGAAVVVLTATRNHRKWGEALAHGARTVLTKDEPLHSVRATVQRLADGLPVIGTRERDTLMDVWYSLGSRTMERVERLHLLTPREADVLGYMMRGLTPAEIARLHVVAEATARTQVKAILHKLGVSSQLAAVALAHEAGWHAPHGRTAAGSAQQPGRRVDEVDLSARRPGTSPRQ